jgi:rRNA-processing protein FCF1
VAREPWVVLLVDTANVVGSRPTGWWRDRAAATRRLVERVRDAAAASQLPEPVVMVLEGAARGGVEEGVADGVTVVHSPGDGDDTIASLAATTDAPVVLVSADRGLRARVRGSGAEVVGPSWLLDRLGG